MDSFNAVLRSCGVKKVKKKLALPRVDSFTMVLIERDSTQNPKIHSRECRIN